MSIESLFYWIVFFVFIYLFGVKKIWNFKNFSNYAISLFIAASIFYTFGFVKFSEFLFRLLFVYLLVYLIFEVLFVKKTK